jgi:hypothetical protein
MVALTVESSRDLPNLILAELSFTYRMTRPNVLNYMFCDGAN